MSCLGERLTALVDGELDHDDRDRALAHLAGCTTCRAEADTMRRLKKRLNSLTELPPSTDLLTRLYGMGDLPSVAQPEPLIRVGEPPVPSTELLNRLYAVGQNDLPDRYRRPRDNRPSRVVRANKRRIPRARYFVAGAATLAALGAGTASYVGTGAARVPAVAPSYAQVVVNQGVGQAQLPDQRKR